MRAWNIILAGVAICGVTTPASAQEWTYVAESDGGSVHYYDATSMTRSGGKVQVWSREDARNADVEDDYPMVSDALEEFDCTAGRSRLIRIIDRDELLQEVERFDFTDQARWNEIKPDTIAAAKRSTYCK